jgi:hypothetical protein
MHDNGKHWKQGNTLQIQKIMQNTVYKMRTTHGRRLSTWKWPNISGEKKSYSQQKRFEQFQKLALQKLNFIQKWNTTYRTSSTSDKAWGIQCTLCLWLHKAINSLTINQTLSSGFHSHRSQWCLGCRLNIFTAPPIIPSSTRRKFTHAIYYHVAPSYRS